MTQSDAPDTPGISLGSLTADVVFNLDEMQLKRALDAAEARLGKKIEIPVLVGGNAVPALRDLRAELDRVSGQTTKVSREQAAASRSLEAQYRAAGQAQVQAARVSAAESAAAAAKIREQAAAYTLQARMAAQAARDEKLRSQATTTALENEQRAYRNLWQARQLSDDEVIEAQRRIYQQALLQAQAVDKQSDAYRRLTQVAAGAQRTIDAAQGINTPGGFAAGITQGILQAVGNLGPFGQLLEQIIGAGMQAAEQAAKEGAQDVARNAGAGLQAGLAGQGPRVRQAAVNLAQQVQDGAEDALDIHSPSRVMRRVGQFAGDGLADGLLSKKAEVASAAKSLANTVEANATPNLTGVSGGGLGGTAVAVMPSAQQNLRGVATQAALATAAVGGTALVVGVLGAAMVNGTQKAAQYQQGLAELSLLTDKLPGQLGNVGTSILKMSVDVRRSFSDLKAGYEEILGASVRGTDSEPAALKALERSAVLAKAARTDTRVAADALTSLLNAYELDVTRASEVSDMLFASMVAGKVRLDEIAGSLGSVAGQAKSLDVPMNELLSAMALLTTRGIPAGTALEYIRSALSNVQKPSSEARDLAKSLGIEFSATALKSMGLVKFLDQLGRGVGDNSEALATLIGDVGGLQAVIGLLNGGLGDTSGILGKVTNSSGELDRQVAKLKGTAQDSLEAFRAAGERVQILFNSGLLPAFTKFLDNAVTPLLVKLGDLNTKLNDVKSPGELKATLKIQSGDDFTTMALKVLGGIGPGLKESFDLFKEVSGLGTAARNLQAFKLQQDLQNRGVIPTPKVGDIAGLKAQFDAILADPKKYQQLLADALAKNTAATVDLGKILNQGNPLAPKTTTAIPQGNVGGLTALARLGSFTRFGTPYGGTYFGGQVHNGEDLFAKTGTALMAPFAGMLSTRWSETTGRVLELIDAQGQRLLLGHLQGFKDSLKGLPDEIQALFKASGGKAVQVAQNQLLGYVGQTGSLAHRDLGPGNAHVHVMAYAADGTVVDPKNVKFVPLAAPTRTNTSSTGAKFTKTDQALIAEARRILDRIDAAVKAGDVTGKTKADAVLKAFENSGPRAAAALEIVRSEVKKTRAEVSKFGQGYDQLKGQLDVAGSLFKLSGNARTYVQSLDAISKAAQTAAASEKRKNGETEKYRALLDLAGDAAGKASQQRKSEAQDDAARTTARLKSQQALNEALAQGREEDARRALDQLKTQQAEELDLVSENASQRAEVIAKTGPAIIAAEDRLANARRDRAVKAAQRTADEAAKVEGADLAAIEQARQETVRQAYQQATAERARARAEQVRAERTASAARVAEEKRLSQELANLQLDQAQATAQRLKVIDERTLDSFKGTAEERLKLVQTLSQAEFDRAERLARSQRNQAQAQATGPNAQAIREKAQADYLLAVEAARTTRLKAVQQATDDVTQAQAKLNAERAKAAQDGYAMQLKSELASLQRLSKEGLITLYDDARARKDQELIAAVYDEFERRRLDEEAAQRVIFEMQAQANTALAEGARKVADELAAAGDSDGAIATLSDALTELMDAAERGEDAADGINQLTDAIHKLTADAAVTDALNGMVVGLSGTIDEQITQVLDFIDTVTDPALLVKAKAFLADLRQQLPKYADPYAAGYVPGPNGFINGGNTGTSPDLTEVASARDLGQRLIDSVDPAEVQVLMGEIGDLLASEVGQRLPDSTRAALEEAVKGGRGYLDALALVTEDAVIDGWERGTKGALANPTPTNEFTAWAEKIFELGAAGLNDPNTFDALTQSLDAARASGELTIADLQNLLALIEQLKSASDNVDLGPIGRMKSNYDGLLTRGVGIEQAKAAGELDPAEAATQLRGLAKEAERYAAAAQAAGDTELAGQFRQIARGAREAAGAMGKLMAAQEVLDWTAQLSGAFGGLAGALGEVEQEYDSVTGEKLSTPWKDLAANLDGAQNAAKKLGSMITDVMRIMQNPADIGAWVSLITNVVSSISDAISGFKKAQAEVTKLKQDFAQDNPLLNPGDYQKAYTRSRGFLADVFGGGPEVVNEIDKIGVMFAKTLQDALIGGIKSGMVEAIKQNDFSLFKSTLRESTFDGLLSGMVDAFLKDEILKSILAPAIKAWSDALKTPDPADDAAALAGIDAAISQVDQQAERFYTDVAPKFMDLQQRWGIDPAQSGGASGSRPVFGNAPDVQYGAPPRVLFPPEALLGFTAFGQAVPEWRAGVAEWRQINAEFRQTVADLGRSRPGGLQPLSGGAL